MPRKKHPYIDKNRSIKFELVRRSKADPLYYEEGASPWVLVPVSNTDKNIPIDPKYLHRVDPNIDPYAIKESDFFGESSDEDDYDDNGDDDIIVDEERQQPPPPSKSQIQIKIPFKPEDYGLPDDGYDYSKHLKKRGEGVFINANGEMEEEISEEDKSKQPVDLLSYLPEELLPQEMRSEPIVHSEKLYEDEVDPEVLAALEDPDAFIEEEGELDDDFVLQADEIEDNKNNNNNNSGSTFNLEKHLQHLLEEAEKEDNLNPKLKKKHVKFDDEDNDDEFAKGPIKHVETEREQRLVDEHFDVVLDSYKDEDIGDLGDEEIVGNLDLDNEYLMSLCDEFIEHPDRIHISKKNQVIKKSEAVNLTKQLLAKRPDLVDISIKPEEDEEEEYNNNYDDDKYQKWDVETIHSAYTNTENLPTVIREPKKIKLSKKTGIPINSFTTNNSKNNNKDDEEENESIKTSPIQYSRKKGETKEEKKQRKQQIKEQKQRRREEKKQNKIMFKEEEKLASKENIVTKKGHSTYIL